MGACRNVVTILLLSLLVVSQTALSAEPEAPHPSESECRPYIEKALKEKEQPTGIETEPHADDTLTSEEIKTSTEDEGATEGGGSNENIETLTESIEEKTDSEIPTTSDDNIAPSKNEQESTKGEEIVKESGEEKTDSIETPTQEIDVPSEEENKEVVAEESENKSVETAKEEKPSEDEVVNESKEDSNQSIEDKTEELNQSVEEKTEDYVEEIKTEETSNDSIESVEKVEAGEESIENVSVEDTNKSIEEEDKNQSIEEESTNVVEDTKKENDDSVEIVKEETTKSEETSGEESKEEVKDIKEEEKKEVSEESKEETPKEEVKVEEEIVAKNETEELNATPSEAGDESNQNKTEVPSPEEEDLTLDIIIPDNLRNKKHVHNILKLDESFKEEEDLLTKITDSTLKELKRLYDSTIKPLEVLYKYRDLSNRHFGDPEIFSKPLVLFMGPWSGGKSSIINYLLDNEYSQNSLRTGAEPSPAYFNILSWGESPTILDGTQLAADWTFSGLQKFGQGLLDRLRGLQLPHPLLEKINIVEIPGILEIRKQVERQFPFNDACQWFIDRADIIFLVYDPSKLDVGPETEAILDQLKGREYQTRIILNKADQVKPEELMRVQGTLIWNISPLMSSSEPPVMYSTSLWSNPYEIGAPIRLLQAQESAFLRDLRYAIDKRVENKIASARRFAVRVRNHAKMVDCYLTTYYNHKTFFGNKKKVADDIIEHPQNYHIYAGLSTLTNISRYDLPDPEVYRDFFRLNPVFEFKKLSDTCTYFRGCPINRLDVTIAYDLPELVGKYKKSAELLLKQYREKKAKEELIEAAKTSS